MNWFCLLTRPRKEAQVAAYLRDLVGREVYFPRLREYRTIRRKRQVVTGPLFPRYVFCRFEPAGFYRQVRYAPDVIDVVQFGGRPAIVPDALIGELRQWAGDVFDPQAASPTFRLGDQVRITDGPLSGLTAVILRAREDDDRVSILLSLLREGARTTVHRDQLELLAAS